MDPRTTTVLGGGAWGTALAVHLARIGHTVRLWVREPEVVQQILVSRENGIYLRGVVIPEAVTPFGDPSEAIAGAARVLAVIPSNFARDLYARVAGGLPADVPVIVATKGIEEGSLALPLDVARDEFGRGRALAVLSGPSFAIEVAQGKPSAVVVASERQDLAEDVQRGMSSRSFRLYASNDPTGVQIGGALKNVIAIAAGVADSLEMGANAQAALITRGLAEIARLGRALGCNPQTLSGLAGMGDLVLTCTGGLSRNRRLGQRIGAGETLESIQATTSSVAEGVRTTRSARELARREGVDMPIVEQLYLTLFEGRPPAEALERLLDRPPRTEEVSGSESGA